MTAIDAGKNVLVEKPFTLNAIQARDLVTAARKAHALPHGGDVDSVFFPTSSRFVTWSREESLVTCGP